MRSLIILVFCILAVAASSSDLNDDGDQSDTYDLKGKMEEIKKKQQGLREEINELRDIVLKSLKVKLGEMFGKVYTTLSDTQTSKVAEVEVNNFEEEIIETENVETKKEIFIKRHNPSRNPVFYAHRVNPYKKTGVVTYDAAVVNIGNGLNLNTGVFTAPVTGIYVLYFSALKNWGTISMTLQIVHNDKTINSRHVSAGERVVADHWATLETHATLPMVAGDTVGIKLHTGDIYDKNLPSDFIGKATTFSGFLLQGPMTEGQLYSYIL